jgi:radical SAM protein with 4Fe4S-binding SPASM domain
VVVLTKENIGGVAQTLRMIAGQGITEVMLNRLNIGGEGIRHQQALCLSPAELNEGYAVADRVGHELGLKLYSTVCTPVCVLDPARFPHIRFSFCDPDPARRAFTLSASGELRYCNHSPEVIGNIFFESIDALLHGASVTKWREEHPAFCHGCEKYTRCRGGCRAASQQLGHDLTAPDPLLMLA